MTYIDMKDGRFYNADCFEIMQEIPDGVIDMILCDLPYGTTQNKWDTILPYAQLWTEYWRIIKKNGAVILTASQPFTSALIMSQIDNFKYTWTWDKINSVRNHLNAKRQPMRITEDITVFYKNQPTYNPEMREGGYKSRKTKPGQSEGFGNVTGIDFGREIKELYPVNLIGVKGHDPNNVIHPTQKPVALFEYLIKTYTDEGDLILDNCAGSGIAAINTKRRWVCIEKEENYYKAAIARIITHEL